MAKLNRISYRLVFARKGLNKNDEGTIEIAAYQKAKKYPRYFSTGIRVKPEFWDDTNKMVKSSHPIFILNQKIGELMNDIRGFEIKMINRYGSFSIDRLHEYAQEETETVAVGESFTDFFERELKEHAIKANSKKAHQQTFNKFKAFRKNIYFDELNYKLIIQFDRFLKMEKLNLNPNTVKKHHQRLSFYIGLAIEYDLFKVDKNPYKKFKPIGTESKRERLIEEELNRIEQLEFEPNEQHLERVRDIYLFQTYCVMRYQDVTNVTPQDVMNTNKGLALKYESEKTGKKMSFLPLYALFRQPEESESRPERILRKYIDQLGELSKLQPDIQFFKITNQYYNRQLKEIAQRADISKDISSHSARRTGSSILHKHGMPFKAVQKLMQHSTPTMTNIYIELSQQEIENELEKYNGSNNQ